MPARGKRAAKLPSAEWASYADQLADTGYTVAQLVDITGADESTVRAWRKAARKWATFRSGKRLWTPDEVSMLGTMSDAEMARRIKRTTLAVRCKRLECKIPAFCSREVMAMIMREVAKMSVDRQRAVLQYARQLNGHNQE